MTGSGYKGDIAIDDITYADRQCYPGNRTSYKEMKFNFVRSLDFLGDIIYIYLVVAYAVD